MVSSAADEIHVAGWPIELGDDYRPLNPAGVLDSRRQFRPAFQGIGAFAAPLSPRTSSGYCVVLMLGKLGDGFSLGFEA